MKDSYANEATKRICLSLSGIVGMADVLIESGRFRGSEEALPHVKVIKEEAQRALDAVMAGLDYDQMRGILRYGEVCELTLIPKSSPWCKKGFFIVDPEDVKAMIKDPLGQCNFCELEGEDAKKCSLRKMLLRTGVIELDDGDRLSGACPYKD